MTMTRPQCAECRDLFDEACAAGHALSRRKPFAHAHHVITGTARRALVDYLTAAGRYRAHKNHCPIRKFGKQTPQQAPKQVTA
jgi:hypothetical protein